MKPVSKIPSPSPRIGGMAFGLLGVLGFSLTLPATRLAVASLDPVIVGLGRSVVAACLAAPLLFITGQTRPTKTQLRGLVLVVLGVIIGFPTITAWAMRLVPASHGAVVLGLLPLATALAGALWAHERPSFTFWCASVVGSLTVVGFALLTGGGNFHPADFALLGAIVLAALGYAEGGRLARELGGWQVICWALVFAAPFLIVPVAITIWRHGLAATPSAWAGFAYVSIISMFLAFFAWFHGLDVGGVARISQLQLLQPFFTLAAAALFLGEHLDARPIACAIIVALSILVGRRSF